MFFSVIVPVYQVEEYLPACIESVLGQTFSDFELILVDDGSFDQCPQICDAYAEKDERIRVLHKENGGLCSARQAGIRIATGDYVLNLDSDDLIAADTLECAWQILQKNQCDMVSFAYRWVKNGQTVSITNDGLEEGLYQGEKLAEAIYPRLLMDENMNHISYYLSGKAVRRSLLTPHQLNVSEAISLGEDLCCVIPCYLHADSVYISKKEAYFYTVRENSLSKKFNTGQIQLLEAVIREITKNDTTRVADWDRQLCRYSCFMCFTVLAAAAEGNHFDSMVSLRDAIRQSLHSENIHRARFARISLKSKITVFLMKQNCYKTAFYFLNFCKRMKSIIKKG